MINKVWKDNQRILEFKMQGRNNFAVLENNELIQVTKLGEISIECCICAKQKKIGWRSSLKKEIYVCQSCNKKGDKNPFYGKQHSEETKQLSSENMKGRYEGDKNPFYGKQHSEETKRNISEKLKQWSLNNDNSFLGKQHSEQSKTKIALSVKKYNQELSETQKQNISLKLSTAQKRVYLKNPDLYKEFRSKAGKITASSPARYMMNSLEKEFHKLLLSNGIEVSYSVILNFMQFDFGHKESKTLFEVHGDYWHGNPAYYNPQSLNKTQIKKMSRDAVKKQWAEKNGFKYIFFWESDIKNSKEKVIKEALDAIKIQTS